MEERKPKSKRTLYTREGNFAQPLNLAMALGGQKIVPVQSGNRYRADVELGKKIKATLFSDKEGPIQKLSGNSFRIMLYCVCCRWPRLKNLDTNGLNELRKKPYGSITEIQDFFGLTRPGAYKWITRFAKEIWGSYYLGRQNNAVRWIDEIKEKDNGEGLNFLDWSFSMTFMEDYKNGVFPTNYPEELIREKSLDDLALALSLTLTEEARIFWSNEGSFTLESEMARPVEMLFKRMNRPTAAPNRKDKEKILRPFIRAIEALNENGFFGKEPYFLFPQTKQKITLDGAKKEGTTWKDLLNCHFVFTLSFEPLSRETRARALSYRKKAAELGNATKGKKKPTKAPRRMGGGITQAGAIDPDAPENGA